MYCISQRATNIGQGVRASVCLQCAVGLVCYIGRVGDVSPIALCSVHNPSARNIWPVSIRLEWFGRDHSDAVTAALQRWSTSFNVLLHALRHLALSGIAEDRALDQQKFFSKSAESLNPLRSGLGVRLADEKASIVRYLLGQSTPSLPQSMSPGMPVSKRPFDPLLESAPTPLTP